MKKTIRDGIADVAMELCRLVDRAKEEAKTHALNALDGDEDAKLSAKNCLAAANAYSVAVKRLDDFRISVERGDFA